MFFKAFGFRRAWASGVEVKSLNPETPAGFRANAGWQSGSGMFRQQYDK